MVTDDLPPTQQNRAIRPLVLRQPRMGNVG